MTVVRCTPSISGERFLRQRNDLARGAVAADQQPATQPLLDRVQRVAGERLQDLRNQGLAVARLDVLKVRHVRDRVTQVRSLDSQGATGNLYDNAAERNSGSRRRDESHCAFATNRAGFDKLVFP